MSLYNEVRPRTLSEIRGQEPIKTQLRAMFETGKIANALLFVGPRGTGKTSIARIVARYVNCENPDEDPCNHCKSCMEILNGTSLDVLELDAASNNKVEDVHQIIESAQYIPIGKKKVYILDEVHMFSQGAWNALLKTLEEPPANCIFILCTTEENKVPATIISRCRKFYFEKISLSVILDTLKEVCEKYHKTYEDDALCLISRASDGCMRDALSILEAFFDAEHITTENVSNTLGIAGADATFDILSGIIRGNIEASLNALHAVMGKGASALSVIRSLMEALTDLLFILQGADIKSVLNTEVYKERLVGLANARPDTGRIVELIQNLTDIYATITKVPNDGYLLDAAIIRTIQYETELMLLQARIEELEQRIENAPVATTPLAEVPQMAESVDVMARQEVSEEANADVPANSEMITEPDADAFISANEIPFEEDDVPPLADGIPAGIVPFVAPSKEDDIFSHLPKGTVISEGESLFDTSPSDSASIADMPSAGDESAAEPEDELPPLDAFGLSGWF